MLQNLFLSSHLTYNNNGSGNTTSPTLSNAQYDSSLDFSTSAAVGRTGICNLLAEKARAMSSCLFPVVGSPLLFKKDRRASIFQCEKSSQL